MYNREERYDDALRVIADLQREYPRNRLLWLEAGSTSLRAGRPADARRALEEGLAKLAADPRPRAFGELARWRYYYGSALFDLKDLPSAGRELRAALEGQSRPWIQGRVHVVLGKLADLAGDRRQATEEYRLATRLCNADEDSRCEDEARALLKRGYRQ
jgi:tetratricopeptide (TPR) repeat protein